MKLQFGELNITPGVEARLSELDFTVPSLKQAIAEHKSGLDGEPSLYCGTYSKYNGGSLQGLWVDLTSFSSFDEFINFCLAIHADEQDPELMFQDYEGFPRQWYSESGFSEEDFDRIIEYSEMCDKHGADAIDDYLDLHDDDVALANFEEAYCGEWDSEEDFAQHLVDECYDIDKLMGNLSQYFDYERFARDLFMYDYEMGEHNHVFRVL